MNRRVFFALSAYATAHAVVSPALPGQSRFSRALLSSAKPSTDLQAPPSAELLAHIVGTRLKAQSPEGHRGQLVLQEVVKYQAQALPHAQRRAPLVKTPGATRAARRIVSYTAVFQIQGEPLSQGMYTIDTEKSGRFEAFLVPHRGSVCHATFSLFDHEEVVA